MRWAPLLLLAACQPLPSPGSITLPLGQHLQLELMLTALRLHVGEFSVEPSAEPLASSGACSRLCAALSPPASVGFTIRYRREF